MERGLTSVGPPGLVPGAARGRDTLGSARTWRNAQPPPPRRLANIPRAGHGSPAFLLFLSSIYVFFLLLVHSRAEQLWISLSFYFFFFFFFFPPPGSWTAASVLQGQSFIYRDIFLWFGVFFFLVFFFFRTSPAARRLPAIESSLLGQAEPGRGAAAAAGVLFVPLLQRFLSRWIYDFKRSSRAFGFKVVCPGPGFAMLAKAVLSLGLWLRLAAGQDAPERGPQPSISNSEGDLLFLLDSSGSVSYYEFSRVKEFMWDLVRPFTFGPKDVQTSIIHISTTPTMEFPFDRYLSSGTLQQAIRDTQQLMGDTNTGKALSYAKEKLFSDEAGARPDVPKVLVWVTDGFSTDDISEPMQLLKDMGVTVFIVSTGRGNYLELSAAASQPPEKHLHFVDVDDLPIITEELRDAIRDVIQANRLHAVDITSSSFRLMWPELLSQETGYYTIEYAPRGDLARKRTKQVSGAHTSLTLSNLAPETTYEVALIPESNIHYFPPQTTRVTTLAEEISPAQVLISESGPRSFHVSWAPTLESVMGYQILYGPLPGNSVKLLEVDGKHNSTVVENLAPNTTYLVTVTAVYKSGKEKSLSAKACTQEEGSKVRHLRFEDMGPNTLKASWDSADGKVLGYRVRCRRQTGPSSVISVSPQIHSVLLTDLASGTTNKVCVKPMYKNQAGKGLCRMVHMQPATEAQGYKHRQRP